MYLPCVAIIPCTYCFHFEIILESQKWQWLENMTVGKMRCTVPISINPCFSSGPVHILTMPNVVSHFRWSHDQYKVSFRSHEKATVLQNIRGVRYIPGE